MRRLACLLVLFLAAPWWALGAEPPKKVIKAAPPQSILDALALCEQDRLNSVGADTTIATAQAALDAGVKAKAAATAAMVADTTAFQALWAQLYGPVVPPPTPSPPSPAPTPPTPTPSPIPTPIPTPPLPPAQRVTMVEISTANCAPCIQMKPAIDTLVASGVPITTLDAADAEAAKYKVAGCPCLIMLVDGAEVTRSVGFLTQDHIQTWYQATKDWAAKQKEAKK